MGQSPTNPLLLSLFNRIFLSIPISTAAIHHIAGARTEDGGAESGADPCHCWPPPRAGLDGVLWEASSGDRCSGNGGGGMRFVQILLLPPLSVFSSRSISSMPRRSGSSCSGSGSTGLREHSRRGCQPRRVCAAAITMAEEFCTPRHLVTMKDPSSIPIVVAMAGLALPLVHLLWYMVRVFIKLGEDSYIAEFCTAVHLLSSMARIYMEQGQYLNIDVELKDY